MIIADVLFEDVDYSDIAMIILPGGGQGTKNMGEHAGLKAQITKLYMNGKWIAAICAAPTILGKLRLLEGKSGTCYPGCEPELKGASVIVDGNISTSRGPGTSFDFALKIVEVFKGVELANRLKEQRVIT